jgi:hypothetical protein
MSKYGVTLPEQDWKRDEDKSLQEKEENYGQTTK